MLSLLNKINGIGENQGALVGANSSQTSFDIKNKRINYKTTETINFEGFNGQTRPSFEVLSKSGVWRYSLFIQKN